MPRTLRPTRSVPDPLAWFDILDDLRRRAVDVEAVAHAAAERDPPASDDPDTRREIRRLCSLVEITHAGVVSLIEEMDDIFSRAMRLGDEMDEVLDDDKTPIPE